tara:strand:- start:52 stop:270 length:219 start_codon:yes stop_codon:yes gene_type:complete
MVTNNKDYMREYMSKYNLTERNREYKRLYYHKNKEKIKNFQKYYYHKKHPNAKYNNNNKIQITKGEWIINFE